MSHIPLSTADSFPTAALILLGLIPLWLAITLFYDLRCCRFLRDHPEVEGKHSMEFLRGRCALAVILLGLMAGLALWRFLPHALSRTVDLKAEAVSAQYTQPTAGEDLTVSLGPLTTQEADPILRALNDITLRQDFRNLLPLEPGPDPSLTDRRRAVIVLTDSAGGQWTLTFYGTELLTVSGSGRTRCYRFYDPQQAERLLTALVDFYERPLTAQQLREIEDYFGVALPGGGRNRACHLFSAYYADPRQLPLADLLRWQEGYPVTGSDLRTIADLGGGELLQDGGLDWVRVPRGAAEAILNQYTGLLLRDLENWEGTFYDEESQCFFCPFTGQGLRGFAPSRGTVDRDTVTLYTDFDVLTLGRDGDLWYIRSFLPIQPEA